MEQSKVIETEVCVIGGGPAGSVTALRLAELGHVVHLVERSPFPRAHIGESLPPSIIPLLHALGLRKQVESAGFLRPKRAIVRWAGDAPFEKEYGEPGFQVDRGQFDAILLEAASRADVKVIQPGTARRPHKDRGGWWRILIDHGNEQTCLRARFVVDAVGKNSALGGDRTAQSVPTLALYGYWHYHGMQGNETRVEAGSNHWYWGAPLPDGAFNATVFVDPKSLPVKSKSDLEQVYRKLVVQSELLRPCASGLLTTPVRCCDATSRSDANPIGNDYLKVGEAAFSIDPLSSQGVQTAIRTGIQAAIVAHTILSPGQDTIAALEFYRNQQTESVTRNQRIAAQLYFERAAIQPTPFWTQRAATHRSVPERELYAPPLPATHSVVRLDREAIVQPTPVIYGNLVIRHAALVHPRLARPIAYASGVAIVDLLASLSQQRTMSELKAEWCRLLPAHAVENLVNLLWETQVICD